MIHNAIKRYADKHITPIEDAFLFLTVHGLFKGVALDDRVLLERENRICRYMVQDIQYFTPHGDEFFGELLWLRYEN